MNQISLVPELRHQTNSSSPPPPPPPPQEVPPKSQHHVCASPYDQPMIIHLYIKFLRSANFPAVNSTIPVGSLSLDTNPHLRISIFLYMLLFSNPYTCGAPRSPSTNYYYMYKWSTQATQHKLLLHV